MNVTKEQFEKITADFQKVGFETVQIFDDGPIYIQRDGEHIATIGEITLEFFHSDVSLGDKCNILDIATKYFKK